MRRSAIPFSPSEAHAIAVGLLSGGVPDPQQHWDQTVYAELEPGDALAAECRALLDGLYRAAAHQVEDAEFGLALFLPSGDVYPLVAGLRDWAQGFLFGFGLAGEALSSALSAEGREALQDFYQIAQLDVSETEDNQNAEALMEVEEYMRVAAMLLIEDVASVQRRAHESH